MQYSKDLMGLPFCSSPAVNSGANQICSSYENILLHTGIEVANLRASHFAAQGLESLLGGSLCDDQIQIREDGPGEADGQTDWHGLSLSYSQSRKPGMV